ncbi:TlpA family protein disulfide reductase [Nonomuraea typhae]|uniref:TlpA family protein disulfide reductase n=1 Tax=Nonomuraea typhae TaxID=2603600 RepID=UPI0012FBAA72|nr:redoxin domain-containing protein [Nonomuraea typhae]
MESLLLVSLTALWITLLLTLAVLLRVVRWVHAREAERLGQIAGNPELRLNSPAPEFQAGDLSGRTVRLSDFRGAPAAFVFVSPFCSTCLIEIPKLVALAPQAREADGTALVLVSDAGARETRTWLDQLQAREGLRLEELTVLIPLTGASFLADYNPKGHLPYFCLLDGESRVQARSLLIHPEWSRVRRLWERTPRLAPWMNVHGPGGGERTSPR